MSHRHFCDAAGHWWECNGTALRRDNVEPSVCRCGACRLPLEAGDHAPCTSPVEVVACPEHREEQRRTAELAKKEHERRAAEFGFDEKRGRMKALPDGAEKHSLAQEIVAWLFR